MVQLILKPIQSWVFIQKNLYLYNSSIPFLINIIYNNESSCFIIADEHSFMCLIGIRCSHSIKGNQGT